MLFVDTVYITFTQYLTDSSSGHLPGKCRNKEECLFSSMQNMASGRYEVLLSSNMSVISALIQLDGFVLCLNHVLKAKINQISGSVLYSLFNY